MDVVRCSAELRTKRLFRLAGLWSSVLLMLGIYLVALSPCLSKAEFWSPPRRFGPSSPSGYYVRLQPSMIKMSHNQQAKVTVSVEDEAGQPIDDVEVGFSPSEGEMTSASSHTEKGMVTATYTVAASNDAPRTAVVIVRVEDVEVTLFIDIVPAVYGR